MLAILTHVGKSTSAAFKWTLVRFFASMSAVVNGESAALDKALAAAWDGARVGALICVNLVVSLEIRLPTKALIERVSDVG